MTFEGEQLPLAANSDGSLSSTGAAALQKLANLDASQLALMERKFAKRKPS